MKRTSKADPQFSLERQHWSETFQRVALSQQEAGELLARFLNENKLAAMQELLRAMKSQSVVVLDLSAQSVSSQGMARLAKLLKSQKAILERHIQGIDLSAGRADEIGCVLDALCEPGAQAPASLTELKLSRCGLQVDRLPTLVTLLAQRPCLRTLDLSDNPGLFSGPQDLADFLQAIKGHGGLEQLILPEQVLPFFEQDVTSGATMPLWRAFSAVVASMPKLESLSPSDARIQHMLACKPIADCINSQDEPKFKALVAMQPHALDLRYQTLTEAGLKFLAALIETQPTLLGTLIARIDLGHATLSGISVLLDAVVKAGEQGARLDELNLSYLRFLLVLKDGSTELKYLGAKHIQTLCRLVKEQPLLKRLGLGNHFLDPSLPELARAVASSSIVELDLQFCGLTPVPLLANKALLNPIGRGLAINLSGNFGLAARGAAAQLDLLEAFAHQASLRQQMLPHATLDWSAALIDPDEVRRLVDLLKAHPAVLRELRCIDMSRAHLEVHTLEALLQVLTEQQGGGVRVLDLSDIRLRIDKEWKPVPSADFPLLGLMVQACPALRVLRLARQTGPNDLRKQQAEAEPWGSSTWDWHSSTPETDFVQFMAGVGRSGITHIDLSECKLCEDDLKPFLMVELWHSRPLLGHSGLQQVDLSGNTEALPGVFDDEKKLCDFVKYFLECHRGVRELRLPEKHYSQFSNETLAHFAAAAFAPMFGVVKAHPSIEVLSPISDIGSAWQRIRDKLSANAARRQAEEYRLMTLQLSLRTYGVPKEVVGEITSYAMRL
jgi:hypothetical protein